MRGVKDNLLGQKFGKLTVTSKAPSERNNSGKSQTYWICKCDCGKEVKVKTYNIKVNKTKSCGCLKIEWCLAQGKKNFKGNGVSSLNSVYSYYKARSKRRKINLELNKEQFKDLILQNCFYCGKEPSCIFYKYKVYEKFKYNSLDRIDSNKGYTLNNVVPCCKDCNSAKMQLTQSEFFNMIKKIYERHKLNE